MRIWVIAAVVIACKGKGSEPAAPAGSGSSSGSGSAPVAQVPADAAPAGALAIDSDDMAPELAIAFDKKLPRTPAVSADGARWAEITTDNIGEPPPVLDWQLEIIDLATHK